MTEAEWLAATQPMPMVALLHGAGVASSRKMRLLACAFFRHVYPPSDPRSWIITVGEKQADGTADSDELQSARGLANRQEHSWAIQVVVRTAAPGEADPVMDGTLAGILTMGRPALHCVRIRDLFGNPFRPVVTDPAWLTSAVVGLAEGIYADRAFDRLPVLADALMEAGCEDADILAHCRGDGPHVRGCWVVDMLLGKS